MKNLIQLFEQKQISYLTNEPMKKHTSFKTGGNAKIFVIPKNECELQSIVKICNEVCIKPFILGNGSNLLVSDDGIDTVVINISKGFDTIEMLDDTTIKIGAGTTLAAACKFALSKNLSGLEFAFGIPGNIGGAALMNAGAYGEEMKNVLVSCEHIDSEGEKGSFSNDELKLSYRKSVYSDSDLIITSATFQLCKGENKDIEAKMQDLLQRRKDKQPLEYPSAGSVFKRPQGYFAGALIEECGLKGFAIGGAMVSEKHAGFIINYNNATTTDVLKLIEHCQKCVKEKFDVELETEIKMV